MITICEVKKDLDAITFCREFKNSTRPKYIFGRNDFAQSIASTVEVNGFIDDYTKELVYLGKPIVRIKDIPNNALVVVAVIGKPLQAEKRVNQFPFESIDYYSFYKYSNLEIQQVLFWDGFIDDFKINRLAYEKIYGLLEDKVSKEQFEKIINFRLSYNLDFMRDFKAIEHLQYFEKFLQLKEEGESFVDIGGFDGYTSQEFIKRCPDYKAVYFFEPEEENMLVAQKRLSDKNNINFYPVGLSDEKAVLNFDICGSSSRINNHGNFKIKVDKLDDILFEEITFLKMDIEGGERKAIAGATNLIKKYHPILAICVYHRFDDFWQIPEQIFTIRNDYKIYLRHYTEGISETVMFFVPIK